MPEYELTRSNTLSKKVKRFGSMLVRGKKSSRPHMPHFLSTPTIDVDLKKNASLSSFSDSEEEFEENLMTPIDSISPQVIPNTESPSPFFPISKASTPVTNNNDVLEACFRNASSYTPIDDDQLKLNLALLVKGQLSDAFEVADKEIEADLEISSRAMLISIQHGTFAI
ncbi:hypothetical protein K501DRAFT_289352 [Backusella circina FSU 941]|nr:hypothetical protein K501DRAFT_289352 [Backusella circina FSU 941]